MISNAITTNNVQEVATISTISSKGCSSKYNQYQYKDNNTTILFSKTKKYTLNQNSCPKFMSKSIFTLGPTTTRARPRRNRHSES